MKYCISLITILLLCALALPAIAQEQVQGRIKSVKDNTATLVFYILAEGPNAPGVVPEKFAAKAAKLEDDAKKQEARGNQRLADNLRKTAEILRSHREVEAQFRDGDAMLQGAVRRPLSAATIGSKLRMDVSVEEVANNQPVRVSLTKLAYQVGDREATIFRNRGEVNGKVYGQMVCAVLTTNPLTVGINANAIQVLNPNNYQFWQIGTMKTRELKANQPFVARAKTTKAPSVSNVRAITVFTGDADIPTPEELSEMGA